MGEELSWFRVLNGKDFEVKIAGLRIRNFHDLKSKFSNLEGGRSLIPTTVRKVPSCVLETPAGIVEVLRNFTVVENALIFNLYWFVGTTLPSYSDTTLPTSADKHLPNDD